MWVEEWEEIFVLNDVVVLFFLRFREYRGREGRENIGVRGYWDM